MRKTLLSILAVASFAVASALTPGVRHHANRHGDLTKRFPIVQMGDPSAPRAHRAVRNIMKASEADETLSMNWGYCEGLYMAIPMGEGQLKGAIVMTEEISEKFAGAVLSSISVGNPLDITTQTPNYELMEYEYENPVRDVTVWLSEGLDEEPFLSVDGELGEDGLKWSTVELPTPYTIESGKPLVIGYTIDIPVNDGEIYALITDYSYDYSEYSCQVYTNLTGFDDDGWPEFNGEYRWQDLGYEFGNICIRAMISGDMLPVDEARIIDYLGPQYVAPDGELVLQNLVQNLGANSLTSLEFTMDVDGMEPQTCTVDVDPAVPYFEYSDILAPTFTSTTVGNNINYSCWISAINGKKVEKNPEDVMEGSFLCIEEGYPKNNVFEEATGTWCGWCVIGYAGMEYMAKNFSDKGFIGIAVHGDDEMDVMGEGQAYEDFGVYVLGFPSAYLNRNMSADIYPDPYDLEDEFYWVSDIPAYADITATLEKTDDEKVLKLSTTAAFGDSEEDCSYMIGYTVMEDGVGPYLQQNYTSGEPDDYYGFEDMPEVVPLKFNDVARNCSSPMGIEGSLPSAVVKGEEYAYETEITLDGVKNPGMVRVVAMVINGTTGAIENAVCVNVPGYTGVQEVATQANTGAFVYGTKGALCFRVNALGANVYTIDGRRVSKGVKGNSLNLPAGIYIVELNGKTSKVVVR